MWRNVVCTITSGLSSSMQNCRYFQTSRVRFPKAHKQRKTISWRYWVMCFWTRARTRLDACHYGQVTLRVAFVSLHNKIRAYTVLCILWVQIKYGYSMGSYHVSKDSDNKLTAVWERIDAQTTNQRRVDLLFAVQWAAQLGWAEPSQRRASRPRRTALVVARVMIHLSPDQE